MGNLAIEANGKVFESTYQDSGVIKKNKDKNKLKEKTNNSVMVESKPTSQADTASRKKDVITIVSKGGSKLSPESSKKIVVSPTLKPLLSSESDSLLKETEQTGRYELSWGEIGDIALKSSGNFVKSMFCDENGFSIERTAMTVGTVAALAFAAPIAASLGASAAVVGAVAGTTKLLGLGLAGYMTYNGGKNIVEGTQKYYESTTEQDAKNNMEQAMDGAVEVTAALPAFLFIKGGANKGKKMASKKAEAKPATETKPTEAQAAEPKPAEPKPAEPKPASEAVNYNEIVGNGEVFNTAQGAKFVKYKNISGNTLKEVVSDKDGNLLYTREFSYASDGSEAGFTIKWAEGIEDVFVKGSNIGRRTRPDGSIWSVKFEDNAITEISQIKPAEVKPAETQAVEPKPAEVKPAETQAAEPKPAEVKPAETQAAEPKPAEVKPAETQAAEPKPAEVKPAETQAAEPKPAEVKPAETQAAEPKPAEVKPAETQAERKIPETKNLSDEKNLKELITKLLNKDSKNAEWIKSVKRFMEDLKGYNNPAFTEAAIQQTLTQSANLLNCGLKVYVENGKIFLTLEDGVTYAVKLKTAVKQNTTPKAAETKSSAEQKVEAQKAEEPKPAEPKPEAAVDYNKSVRSKLSKSSDGSTNEYFYNEKGDMVKLIERDNTGKIKYKNIYEYNSSGEKVKYILQTSYGAICETFYKNGTEAKKIWKWDDGIVEELYPKSKDIYEGVRTYPDGRKVKIREENRYVQELGAL